MRFWHAVYRGEDIKPGNAKPITPRHAAFRRLGRGRSDPLQAQDFFQRLFQARHGFILNSLALARSFLPRDAVEYPAVPLKYHGTCALVEVLPALPKVFDLYAVQAQCRRISRPHQLHGHV